LGPEYSRGVMPNEDSQKDALDLVHFVNAAPTPYHAVREVARRLESSGFTRLDEREPWRVEPGTRGYAVRAGGTLVGFIAGAKSPSEAGFVLIGAHTDSPNLRVKPNPELSSVGYRQLEVEVYGGVLLSTWLDRDLSIAGRVTLGDGATRLVDLKRAVCRIPNLAIHLNRDVNSQGLVLNAQSHLCPVLTLDGGESERGLKHWLAAALGSGAQAQDVVSFDLCLYDVQPATLAGPEQEFVFGARLDNLASCHAATEALLRSGDAADATRVIALYDHEEVGSQSAAGARSRFLLGALERLAESYASRGAQALQRALARALLVSADMAHAVHPNYAEKHDKQHAPRIGDGPVLKVNVNQSYASDGPGMAVFAQACSDSDAALQRFVSRNDLPCGSTIGPISAARLGIRTVDVGNPMLSMHSCREMAGANDVAPMIRALSYVLGRSRLPDSAA
jgi:aspartyl aminopeptidase